MVNRGEIWWLEHPEIGRRPVCVVTRQAAISVLTSLMVVPATRSVRDIPTEVRLDVDDGMPQSCALSFDNIATVPKSMLTEKITRLSVRQLIELCKALRYATGC